MNKNSKILRITALVFTLAVLFVWICLEIKKEQIYKDNVYIFPFRYDYQINEGGRSVISFFSVVIGKASDNADDMWFIKLDGDDSEKIYPAQANTVKKIEYGTVVQFSFEYTGALNCSGFKLISPGGDLFNATCNINVYETKADYIINLHVSDAYQNESGEIVKYYYYHIVPGDEEITLSLDKFVSPNETIRRSSYTFRDKHLLAPIEGEGNKDMGDCLTVPSEYCVDVTLSTVRNSTFPDPVQIRSYLQKDSEKAALNNVSYERMFYDFDSELIERYITEKR